MDRNFNKGDKMSFIVSRHGKTDWNALGLLAGISDNARINQEGVVQASKTVNYFGKRKIDRLLTSSSTRALQTLNPLAKTLRILPSQYQGLKEMDFGTLDGKPINSAAEHMELRKHNLYHRFPEGESYNDVVIRVRKIINPLIPLAGEKTYYLQSHGGTIRVILGLLMNLDFYNVPSLMTTLDIKNSVVFEIEIGQNPTCKWVDVLNGETGQGLIYNS
jgi:2,3-bisphosphoglycerate-dependent phosphoglycerate mutase